MIVEVYPENHVAMIVRPLLVRLLALDDDLIELGLGEPRGDFMAFAADSGFGICWVCEPGMIGDPSENARTNAPPEPTLFGFFESPTGNDNFFALIRAIV